MEYDRRRSPRYLFFASAELVEDNSDVRIASRVSELSLHGCYLDTMNPFPAETLVLLEISAREKLFQTKAKIVYARPNVGAGVVFLEGQLEDQAVLQNWLTAVAEEQRTLTS